MITGRPSTRRRRGCSRPRSRRGRRAKIDERGGEEEHRPPLHDPPALPDGHAEGRPLPRARGSAPAAGRPRASSSCTCCSRCRSAPVVSAPISSSNVGSRFTAALLPALCELREAASRSGLHRSEREVEVLRHLALRHAAPVRELDHFALARLELFEGAVHAPRDVRVLRLLRRARLVRRELGQLGVGSGPVAAQPVDDRVPGDRVEPAAGRAAFRPVRRGGAPDRRERLLDGVLGVAAVAEPAAARGRRPAGRIGRRGSRRPRGRARRRAPTAPRR